MAKVDWIDAEIVERGMRQNSMSGPRLVTRVADAVEPDKVIVFYDDDTLMEYNRREQLPIISEGDNR